MEDNLGIDTGMAHLLANAPGEELTYGFVMECLKFYKNPWVKLNHLLKMGALIPIKKGIYIFGKTFARHPYSPEVLANMIYGPSYVSLEWACQYYRLIPEGVMTVTSVTTQRSKRFMTPIGSFTYNHLPQKAYSVGITIARRALFATKEKALCDLLVLRRGKMVSEKQMKETLFEDLRVEEEDFESLNKDLLQKIYDACPHSALKYLMKLKGVK